MMLMGSEFVTGRPASLIIEATLMAKYRNQGSSIAFLETKEKH
jgi:hypothetical protein